MPEVLVGEHADIRVLLLAEEMYFGRDALATRRSPLLWPVLGRPALEHVLDGLADQGFDEVVLCTDENPPQWLEVAQAYSRLTVHLQRGELPRGSAGHLRQAISDHSGHVFVILPAAMVRPPVVADLVALHRKAGGVLTVIPDSADARRPASRLSEMYVCARDVVDQIHAAGYADVKEGLIATLSRAGKTVHAVHLSHSVGDFRTWPEYLAAMALCLDDKSRLETRFQQCKGCDGGHFWLAEQADVAAGARIAGPAVIQAGAKVEEGAVLLGSVVLEPGAIVERGGVVADSMLWTGCRVESGAAVRRCVCDEHACVSRGCIVEDDVVVGAARPKRTSRLARSPGLWNQLTSSTMRLMGPFIRRYPWLEPALERWAAPGLWTLLLMVAFVWSYWPNLRILWALWLQSDEYSSGLLVPFLAGYVLWSRREALSHLPIRPCLWGLVAFLGAQAFRLFGVFFMLGSAERLSIVLTIGALVLWLLGWQVFRRVVTVLLFLFLMIPWPNSVQQAITIPLQSWATSSAVFCLEMLGYLVSREGNIIHIGDTSVAVLEACNGLRMIVAFWVIGALVVLLMDRPLWQKVVVLISCLPIALVCNTVRLTLTSVAFTFVRGETWEALFHDFGGYAMMPLALGMVMAEFWLLRALTTPPERVQP